ncbi:Helix-turn-helix transcriptional regulator (plasmid) [Candidatus Trichorickettsia mobilis]|uniref:winged helix-turn-helix transcriptional regulator n=1 Tax=Candidatus Trichorickettsia mobilis TaxID=1346319 RepID=UPI002B259287|nr:helix-turn-helix domain-containing protein [Candidatus Trichorickettsia mobilis]WPY01872.1 Helix-turn-helix transcriptional regulator [Candidatus Trichorickettsia mobilis]
MLNIDKLSPIDNNAPECLAIREVLSLVGNKWSMLIIAILAGGTRRFSEIQHNIEGISQRMLTRTLRELEWNGLLVRRVEGTVPPSVYYSLTPLGSTLLSPIALLVDWVQNNHQKIQEAQQKFDKKRPTKI